MLTGAAAAPDDAGPARHGRLIRPWPVYPSRHAKPRSRWGLPPSTRAQRPRAAGPRR